MKDREKEEIKDEKREEKKLLTRVGDNARRVLKIIREKGEEKV